jgi:hypothetical protein
MGPVPVVQQPEHGEARRTAEVIGANQVLPATPRPDEYDFAHFRERLPAPVPKFVDLSRLMQRQIPPGRAFSCTAPTLAPNLAALSVTCTLRKWKPLLVRRSLISTSA